MPSSRFISDAPPSTPARGQAWKAHAHPAHAPCQAPTGDETLPCRRALSQSRAEGRMHGGRRGSRGAPGGLGPEPGGRAPRQGRPPARLHLPSSPRAPLAPQKGGRSAPKPQLCSWASGSPPALGLLLRWVGEGLGEPSRGGDVRERVPAVTVAVRGPQNGSRLSREAGNDVSHVSGPGACEGVEFLLQGSRHGRGRPDRSGTRGSAGT